MRNAQRQQRSHRIMQRLSITAVQLGDDEEDECQRHVLEEIGVAVGGEFERGVLCGGGAGGGLGGVLVRA